MERVVPGGFGLLRDDAGIVLLRGALPGERVSARVTARRGQTRLGVVERVFDASLARTAPDCSVADRCGGCDFLHVAPDAVGDLKRAMVMDALRRTGGLDDEALQPVSATRVGTCSARSRRRARVAVNDEGKPGFFAPSSHRVVPWDGECLALSAALEDAVVELCTHIEVPAQTALEVACDDAGRVSLVVGHKDKNLARRVARRAVEVGAVTGAWVRTSQGRLTERSGEPSLWGEVAPGVTRGPYGSDAGTFTQATRFGGVAILAEVVDALSGTPGGVVLELFAGAGHLSLALAAAGHAVIAVEGEEQAFTWLEHNVQHGDWRERIFPVRGFIEGKSLHALVQSHTNMPVRQPPGSPVLVVDALVVDPPRTGIPDFGGILDAVRTPRLVMVSCDLATGARDLRIARNRGYQLDKLVPIDAFPRTSHVEWVASLSLPASG